MVAYPLANCTLQHFVGDFDETKLSTSKFLKEIL